MSRATIIFVSILIAIVPMFALIAADNAQYNTPITVKNGVAYVETDRGMVDMDTVNENDQTVPAQRITGYNTPVNNTPIVIPSELPHAGIAHGDYNCTLVSNGVSFTVTQTTPCE